MPSPAVTPPPAMSPAATPPAASGKATVSWIPPTQNTDGTPLDDLTGFRVYVGKTSAALTEKVIQIDDATITRQLVDQLATGTWYFGVVALNSLGAESPMSAVGSKTI